MRTRQKSVDLVHEECERVRDADQQNKLNDVGEADEHDGGEDVAVVRRHGGSFGVVRGPQPGGDRVVRPVDRDVVQEGQQGVGGTTQEHAARVDRAVQQAHRHGPQ